MRPVVCKPKFSMTSICSTAGQTAILTKAKAGIVCAFNPTLSRCEIGFWENRLNNWGLIFLQGVWGWRIRAFQL